MNSLGLVLRPSRVLKWPRLGLIPSPSAVLLYSDAVFSWLNKKLNIGHWLHLLSLLLSDATRSEMRCHAGCGLRRKVLFSEKQKFNVTQCICNHRGLEPITQGASQCKRCELCVAAGAKGSLWPAVSSIENTYCGSCSRANICFRHPNHIFAMNVSQNNTFCIYAQKYLLVKL